MFTTTNNINREELNGFDGGRVAPLIRLLATLQVEIRGLTNRPMPELQPHRDNITKLRKEVEDLKRVTTEEQARLAELRRDQAELKEKNEQLKAFSGRRAYHER